MSEIQKDHSRPKEKLSTVEALANDFIDTVKTTSELGINSLLSEGAGKKEDLKAGRTLIVEDVAQTLTQMTHLQFRVTDDRRLTHIAQSAIQYINEGRIRFVEEIFQAAKRREKDSVIRGLNNIFTNFLEWYFKEHEIKTFEGKPIAEIIAGMREKTLKVVPGGIPGGPQIAKPVWGPDLHIAMGSPPTQPREVQGGRMTGR